MGNNLLLQETHFYITMRIIRDTNEISSISLSALKCGISNPVYMNRAGEMNLSVFCHAKLKFPLSAATIGRTIIRSPRTYIRSHSSNKRCVDEYLIARQNQEAENDSGGGERYTRWQTLTYREPKERERTVAGYRHKGDSLTAIRLIRVTGWKINGPARWGPGLGKRCRKAPQSEYIILQKRRRLHICITFACVNTSAEAHILSSYPIYLGENAPLRAACIACEDKATLFAILRRR